MCPSLILKPFLWNAEIARVYDPKLGFIIMKVEILKLIILRRYTRKMFRFQSSELRDRSIGSLIYKLYYLSILIARQKD
jgi:hypothetical protein